MVTQRKAIRIVCKLKWNTSNDSKMKEYITLKYNGIKFTANLLLYEHLAISPHIVIVILIQPGKLTTYMLLTVI